MTGLSCIILAAGEGTRMQSKIPKVLSEILFKPMLGWVLDSVRQASINDICVIIGHKNEMVVEYLLNHGYNCEISIQSERKGTAHAVSCAAEFLKYHEQNDVLIINGDTPFMDVNSILKAHEKHIKNNNAVTVVTADVDVSYGYGRILRQNDNIQSIIEECDATDEQKKIKEINSGTYWFNSQKLLEYLKLVKPSAIGEYYLTSIIKLFINNNQKVGTYRAKNAIIALGANDPEQLKILNNIAKMQVIQRFKEQGIYIPYEENVIIGKDVQIGEGTMILSDVTIRDTIIGKNCIIGPESSIQGQNIADNTQVIFQNLVIDSVNHSVYSMDTTANKVSIF
ncbi:MAG: NTP transferase domain-containing protein [Candidatus Improbicoccus devescovinae]|nr:MAG: NTP transferase domain-containing protein [Candidatus Improbicoccus devescovinae]